MASGEKENLVGGGIIIPIKAAVKKTAEYNAMQSMPTSTFFVLKFKIRLQYLHILYIMHWFATVVLTTSMTLNTGIQSLRANLALVLCCLG